ncbi:hypothetical protein KAH55_04350 [bacterium]|nr:hypothetical protein [bacterium]
MIRYLAISVILVLFLVLIWGNVTPTEFTEIGIEGILVRLGYMFLAALLLERSLEVVLTAFRAGKSDRIKLNLRLLKEGGVLADDERVKDAECKSMNRSNATRDIAMWSSLVMGISISVFGLRMLNSIVVTANMAPIQAIIFQAIDVFFTGGVIAGGSDGIHKIMEKMRHELAK